MSFEYNLHKPNKIYIKIKKKFLLSLWYELNYRLKYIQKKSWALNLKIFIYQIINTYFYLLIYSNLYTIIWADTKEPFDIK